MDFKTKLLICEELIKTNKPVNEQVEIWKLKKCGSRGTYFHYKKRILLDNPDLTGYVPRHFKYVGSNLSKCYFCLKDAQVIHINQNKQDNRKDNLLPLCQSCHNKVHRILQIA